jgi:transposase-like protein
MPKGVERDWPADDELLALVQQEGSINAAAARLGMADKTLRSRFVRRGLLDQAKAITQTPTELNTGEVSREEILEAENRELRLALAKDRKTSVRSERVVGAIERALKDVPPPNRARAAKAPQVDSDAHHCQFLMLSDFHGGEVVDPDVVNGLNSYDWQIMEERCEELVASLLSHKRNSPKLTKLVIGVIGDMCSGSNHLELAVTNEYPLAVQGVRIGALLGRLIEKLVPHYAKIEVYWVEGNHPRLSQKPAAKNPDDNMDTVAGHFAAEFLKPYKSVRFTIGRGSVRFKIAGRNVYMWHGDGIRSSMPGVPWGGVLRRVNTMQSQFTDRVDHWVLGHYHQANVVQGGRILMNGSLKGVDEYCLKSFGGGDPPTQLLVTFDEKASRMTDVKYITPTAGLP